MTGEVPRSWTERDEVAAALRQIGRDDVAEALDVAERGGATSTEILFRLGAVMRAHRILRPRLSEPARRAWDSIMAQANREYPLRRLDEWLARWMIR